MSDETSDELRTLHEGAYEAMDRGDLAEASRLFGELLRHEPDDRYYHYMRGLALKYARQWEPSLHHNLRAAELADDDDRQAAHWNAAIAATALGDWARARQMWHAEGIQVPGSEGPIEGDFGVAVVRLHPWKGGETVFVRRIDPVRARLLNVPLPESGHRFGDIVLHDGAATGYRYDGNQRKVPVFNEMQRLVRSEFQTFVVFVSCETEADQGALLEATAPGIAFIEDWTRGISYYCLRCSYGTPHRHDRRNDDAWQPDRNLGVAAQSRRAVEKLVKDWAKGGRGRRVEGIESRECIAPEPEEGHVWWREPEDASPDGEASPER